MLRSALRLLLLFGRLQLLHIRIHMEYRLDFWIGMMGIVLRQLAGFAFIWALFSTIPVIAGWQLWEVAFLYALVTIPQGFSALLFDGPWHLRRLIHGGQFDLILTRPLSPMFQLFTQASSLHGFGSAGLGFVVLAYAAAQLGVSWDAGRLLYLALTLISSTVMIAAINLMTNSIGFWDPAASGQFPFLVINFIEFAKLPITPYSQFFQSLFTWVLPFAMLSYYPALPLLGRPEATLLSYLAPVSGWVVALIAWRVWRFALRHYQGVGH